MTIRLQDIEACTECGAVHRTTYLQTVNFIAPRKGVQVVGRYCRWHRLSYDTCTTTSGYARYYSNGVEVPAPTPGPVKQAAL